MRAPLALVAAVGPGGVIGDGDRLPWHLPEDLRRFRQLTWGHAIVMGRRTWASIGRALPGRRSMVLSRDPGLRLDGAEVFADLASALAAARAGGDDEPRVIGGAQVYAEALDLATRLLLTEVDLPSAGDVRFPAIDPSAWEAISVSSGETPGLRFVELRRRPVLPSAPREP